MREHDKIGLTILYVEDDSEIREGIATFLNRRVEKLITASNGEEGLELFRQYSPDIIITDINMPIKNGLEMLSDIRTLTQKTLFIITSAYNDAEYFTQAIELGVTNFLIKPIDVVKLHTVLQKAEKVLKIEKELELERKKVQVLFNFQDNIVFLSTEDEILEANYSFCNFFCCATLEEFKQKHTSIEPFFIHENDYFYPSQNIHWLESILDNPHQKNVAKLRNAQGKEGVFLIKATRFPGDDGYIIVSLTDVSELEHEKELLEKLATTDMLTQTFNRRHFTELLELEIHRYERYKMPFSLIMFDIDHFKQINDSFGHQNGDTVLVKLCEAVRNHIRESDVFSRWGGEEFMLMLVGSDAEKTLGIAEHLRTIIENVSFDHGSNVTCSFGITQMQPFDTIDTLTKRVDDALYQAKNGGRNRSILI